MKLLTAALAALLLSACGGGGDSGAPPAPVSPLPRALVHASARVAPDAGYALHMQPLAETDKVMKALAGACAAALDLGGQAAKQVNGGAVQLAAGRFVFSKNKKTG